MMVATMSGRSFSAVLEILLVCLAPSALAAEGALFTSRQLTPVGEYTFGIEGPAVDAAGTLYVVNYRQQGTIGKLGAGAARSERRNRWKVL